MARGRANSNDILVISLTAGLFILFVAAIQWLIKHPYVFYPLLAAVFLLIVGAVAHVFHARRRNLRIKEEERLAEAERQEQERLRIESLLRWDAVRDEINYIGGAEFEKCMANFLRRQGYAVEETPLSGDQGVDLVLPDFDGKRVVVQLKRYTRPVGNVAVQATFAGMAHYRAEEGWIITTSAFTKSARELAKSTRVRLIDGKELADWLEDVREQE